MKKTLLAAALVAGFAGVAQAESSVQLYGIVDAGVGYTYTSTKYSVKGNNLVSDSVSSFGARESIESGNRWGLKGKEDLGNGTSVIFQLESGFSIATGESGQGKRLFGRKAIIGLSGDSWGTFTVGRQANAADDFMGDFDPFGAAFGQAAHTSTFADGTGSKADIATLKYVSPDFSGFKLAASAAFDYKNETDKDDKETTTRQQTLSLGLGYTGGPFSVAATYTNQKQDKTTGNVYVHAWNVGVSYDLDVAKLHAMYGQQINGFIGKEAGFAGNLNLKGLATTVSPFADISSPNKDLSSQAWVVGVTAPVGENGKVMFSYQGGRIKVEHKPSINTHIYSLGYTHVLSKRTDVYSYVSYGRSSTKDGQTDTKSTYKSTQFAVGLRHKF